CEASAWASRRSAPHAPPAAAAAAPTTSTAASEAAIRPNGAGLLPFLPELGSKVRLGLRHAELRRVELVEAVLDLRHVVVVHAVDELLQRRDAGAQAVAELAVGCRQVGGHVGGLAVRLERLHVVERLLRRGSARAVVAAR